MKQNCLYCALFLIIITFYSCSEEPPLEFYEDKEIVQLLHSTRGKGVNLVFMGDGFTYKDLAKGRGKYEKSVRRAVDYFFSVEPYKSYRDYFNVYMIVAESEDEGIPLYGEPDYNIKFNSKHGNDSLDRRITFDWNAAVDYVNLLVESKSNIVIDDITATIILNSEKYQGTCYWESDGFSVSLCPISNSSAPYDFRGIINHETGGHGFGKLADEYIESKNWGKYITEDEKDNVRWWQDMGFYRNVDLTSILDDILWKDFISLPAYKDCVNAFQGAYYYNYGVWRPEQNSCMINNIPYYNAPSRWLIMKKIKEMAGESFTFNDFLRADEKNTKDWQKYRLKSGHETMIPTAAPVFVDFEENFLDK